MSQSGRLRRTYFTHSGDAMSGRDGDAAGALRNEREELVTMAEKIQSQLFMAVERLLLLVDQIDGRIDVAREQLAYYQEHVWPLLLQADTDICWLSAAVRDGIDSCTISEERLSVLLEVNKFQVKIKTIAEFLSRSVNDEIEQVLELRERGVRGLSITSDTLDGLQRNYQTLRLKLLTI